MEREIFLKPYQIKMRKKFRGYYYKNKCLSTKNSVDKLSDKSATFQNKWINSYS